MRGRQTCLGAGVLWFVVLLLVSPARAQFICTGDGVTADRTCVNTSNAQGNASAFFADSAASRNDTVSNPGTANGFSSTTTGGGNATATNSGSNSGDLGILALTQKGGDATATNSGSNTGLTFGIEAQTNGGGNATAINSGSNSGGTVGGGTFGIFALTGGGGDATATNSGSNTGGIRALTAKTGNAAAVNSGSNTGQVSATAMFGDATAINSGSNNGNLIARAIGSGNATTINSGSNNNGILSAVAAGNATIINSGTAAGFQVVAGGNATLTNIVGGRIISAGSIFNVFQGATETINFVGGNWLFTFNALTNATVNAGGAPFVAAGNQVAVLDPTTFALADRSLMNFTGEISEMLQGRFAGMAPSPGGGGAALGFAGAPNSSIADQAKAAFSGIPSVAMSYASGSRPVISKAAASAPYYDTMIWASGFGGERKQHAVGNILPTTDTAFGGAMGIDRIVNSNLRLGAFAGAGGSHEAVELGVQSIDATYVFGGGYGRFDWETQYLDFSLYGGGIGNKSTRQVANNLAPNGLENATASYGGWFISPEITYGYCVPFNAITVTPRVRLRYVGGELDGYSELGSMQNLSVGSRAIDDLEERGEVELSTITGTLKASASLGVIGLERLGNPTINTVLLGQNLSFVTPGQASAVGGVLGMRMEYRARSNVALFVAGEGTAMSDKSDSFAATGGARVSF